ncbi:MAG: hypothetical protein ABSF44_10585 [Candidatus Bathyarchaeia archaeon]|jgi:RNA polymerase subunit RPABC4/transcription elongation factor Spt4
MDLTPDEKRAKELAEDLSKFDVEGRAKARAGELAKENRPVYDYPDATDLEHFRLLKQATLDNTTPPGPKKLIEAYKGVGYAEHEEQFYVKLPGHGKAYENCGESLAKGCDNHKHHADGKTFVRLGKRSCNRKECPVCYEGWASKGAERATIRIAHYLVGPSKVRGALDRICKEYQVHPPKVLHKAVVDELEDLIQGGTEKPIHVVLSPPQENLEPWAQIGIYRSMKAKAVRLAKLAGLRGSSIIPHPYRLRCKACKAKIPDYHRECPECGGSEFEWMFSPHFHYLGFGWILGPQKIEVFYKAHGWVVKNLGVRDTVYGTFQYILSHAGVGPGFHTVSWFGSLGYRAERMREVPKLKAPKEKCPECGAYLSLLEWIGAVDRGPPPTYCEELARLNAYANDLSDDPENWRRR